MNAFAWSIIDVTHMRYTLWDVTQALKSCISGSNGASVPAFFFAATWSRSGMRNLAVAHTRLGTQKPICMGPALSSVRRLDLVPSTRAFFGGCLGFDFWL